MPAVRYPIRVGPRSRLLLRLFFGVRADDSWVELGDGPYGWLEVQFGWSHFRTPMTNLAGWRIEGPFLWITAIGLRMSVRHRDLTFGGSHHGGVRIDFVAAQRWSIFNVPAIYIPADDLEGLAAELERRGVPGRDARRRPA